MTPEVANPTKKATLMWRFSLLLELKLRGGIGTVDRTILAREYTCRRYPERWSLSCMIFVRGFDNKIHDTRLLILMPQSVLKFQRSLKSILAFSRGYTNASNPLHSS